MVYPVTLQEYLTVDGLSQYLNQSKSTIYKKVLKRLIPHYKLQGMLLFKRTEIQSWIEESRVETISEIKNQVSNIFQSKP